MSGHDSLMLVPQGKSKEMMAVAKEVAGLVKQIVLDTAVSIGSGDHARRYVKVEGWQAIANCFGCVASSRDVKKVHDPLTDEFIGYSAVGEIKRVSDGTVISTAEGYVGTDEFRWFGGKGEVWDKKKRKKIEKVFKPEADFAIRAMAQTRAMSRAARSAFAFIITMIDKKMSTTPAEEVTDESGKGDVVEGEFEKVDGDGGAKEKKKGPGGKSVDWKDYYCTYGTKDGPLRGKQLGELTDKNLDFLYQKFVANPEAQVQDGDKQMVIGLKLWHATQEQQGN